MIWFDGISDITGYLMLNPVFTQMKRYLKKSENLCVYVCEKK